MGLLHIAGQPIVEVGFGHVARGAVASFTPSSLAGLVLEADATDIASLFQDSARTTPVTTTGQPVGNWAAGTSAQQLMQSTSGKRPAYTAAGGAGGGPGVITDGIDDFMATAAFGMAACTFFVVAKIVSASGFLVTHYDATTNGVYTYKPTGYTATASRGGVGASFNDATVWADTSTHAQYALVVDSGAPLLSLYRNGALVGSNSLEIGTTVQTLSLTIAADVNGSFVSQTVYSAVLAYNRALPPSERAQVESYLAAKFGL